MQYFSSKKECFNLPRTTLLSTYLKSLLVTFLLLLANQSFAFQATEEVSTTGPTHDKYVVGYYAQWAIYARDFNVSDIEAENLTNLMYAFYDTIFDDPTETSTITSLDVYADIDHAEDPGLNYNEGTLRGNMGALKLLKE